jgi:homopolymeric O-antigen transport system ATP-binding protein
MASPVITVEYLGDAYRLGLKKEMYLTFREALMLESNAPLRRFGHLSNRGDVHGEIQLEHSHIN